MKIPKTHPRHTSLMTREKLVKAWKAGVAVPEGLIAHGRGEAWDYLLGEETSAPALVAEKAAAAYLVSAKRPLISVNGNIFPRTEARINRIVRRLAKAGARNVLGPRPGARIPRLDSNRALAHRDGIYRADVVLVPLEDGDRTEALVRMGKTVVAIDLNPLSRTSQMATVPVVDELTRAVLNIDKFVRELRGNPEETARIIRTYSKAGNLGAVYSYINWRLRNLARKRTRPKRRRVT